MNPAPTAAEPDGNSSQLDHSLVDIYSSRLRGALSDLEDHHSSLKEPLHNKAKITDLISTLKENIDSLVKEFDLHNTNKPKQPQKETEKKPEKKSVPRFCPPPANAPTEEIVQFIDSHTPRMMDQMIGHLKRHLAECQLSPGGDTGPNRSKTTKAPLPLDQIGYFLKKRFTVPMQVPTAADGANLEYVTPMITLLEAMIPFVYYVEQCEGQIEAGRDLKRPEDCYNLRDAFKLFTVGHKFGSKPICWPIDPETQIIVVWRLLKRYAMGESSISSLFTFSSLVTLFSVVEVSPLALEHFTIEQMIALLDVVIQKRLKDWLETDNVPLNLVLLELCDMLDFYHNFPIQSNIIADCLPKIKELLSAMVTHLGPEKFWTKFEKVDQAIAKQARDRDQVPMIVYLESIGCKYPVGGGVSTQAVQENKKDADSDADLEKVPEINQNPEKDSESNSILPDVNAVNGNNQKGEIADDEIEKPAKIPKLEQALKTGTSHEELLSKILEMQRAFSESQDKIETLMRNLSQK